MAESAGMLTDAVRMESPDLLPEGGEAMGGGSVLSMAVATFRENRLAVIGLGIVIFMVLFCFVGPVFYHTNQIDVNIAEITQPPSQAHILGTDQSGYDVMGRLMAGGQLSLLVGISAALLATTVGVIWGAAAGFIGGVVDSLMMRFVDTLLAIPTLFLLLLLASIVTLSAPVLVFVIAATAWLVPARLIRGEALSLRERDFVAAVRVMGGGRWRIIMRHIIPNSIGTIMVNATFQVADAILALAALGFLGLGIPPPAADWGSMLMGSPTPMMDTGGSSILPALPLS